MEVRVARALTCVDIRMTTNRLSQRLPRRTVALHACLVVVWLATPTRAIAADDQHGPETSRAQALEAARDSKAAEIAPPERSFVERALYAYDNPNQSVLRNILIGWKGFHLAGGDFPAGAGFKFGVGFDRAIGSSDPDPRLPNRIDVTARAAYSTRGYTRLSAGLNLRNLGGAPVDVTMSSQYYEFPQEDFFGLGRTSQKSNRTDYLLDSVDTGVAVRWRPALLDIGGGLSYLTPRIGRGTDSRFPSTEVLFNPATIPGFVNQPDFIRADASLAFDWRDNPAHPHHGGRYGVLVSQFHDQDLDAFDFHRVDIDLQQYVPLPNRYRLLAVRAAAVVTDSDANQHVPFYFQPTLGGAQTLRGFREFRFRDQNSLLFSAEYRWEAWWALDGALFVDAGTVAPTRRALSLGDMDVSYGIGFRFHSNGAVIGRLDLAFSREGFVPLLRFEHVF